MFRGVLGAIAIAVAIIIAANYAPLLSGHTDQDKCTFGPVSNEQYRAYLLKAQKQRPKWPAFSNDGREIGAQLNSQLSGMLTPEATLFERIAIIRYPACDRRRVPEHEWEKGFGSFRVCS